MPTNDYSVEEHLSHFRNAIIANAPLTGHEHFRPFIERKWAEMIVRLEAVIKEKEQKAREDEIKRCTALMIESEWNKKEVEDKARKDERKHVLDAIVGRLNSTIKMRRRFYGKDTILKDDLLDLIREIREARK